jgi:putative ABC transport system substrate-binding protein
MRESCTYGSARGALSNERPYRYRRRDFITLLSGAAAAWPMAAGAQQARVIGAFTNSAANDLVSQSRVKAFTEQLRKLGWVDGKNLRIEYRWDPGNPSTRHPG